MRNIMMVGIIALSLMLFVAGCTAQCPECNCPVCEERQCPVTECTTDCASCPANTEVKEVPKEVITYKYVCQDKSIKESAEECSSQTGSDEAQAQVSADTEASPLINSINLIPACIYGYNGAEIDLDIGSMVNETSFEIREKGQQDYKEVKVQKDKYLKTKKTFTIDGDKYATTDFNIEGGKIYELRMKFYLPAYKKYIYSQVYEIDTQPGQKYVEKTCSS